jgi:hypothetical protein
VVVILNISDRLAAPFLQDAKNTFEIINTLLVIQNTHNTSSIINTRLTNHPPPSPWCHMAWATGHCCVNGNIMVIYTQKMEKFLANKVTFIFSKRDLFHERNLLHKREWSLKKFQTTGFSFIILAYSVSFYSFRRFLSANWRFASGTQWPQLG